MNVPIFAQVMAFGVTVHIRGNNSLVATALSECLLPGWSLTPPDREPDVFVRVKTLDEEGRNFQIEVEDEPLAGEPVEAWELGLRLDQVIHIRIAELSPVAVFVHAGVVGWRGGAIIIPGTSMAGKSTLTRALVEAGGTYYSDEFAPIFPDGRVCPYPKPHSRRQEGQLSLLTPAAELGWHADLPALPVSAIAAVHFAPKGSEHPAQNISAAEAAMKVLSNTVPMQHSPARSLSAAAAISRNAYCLSGARGDAAEFAAALLHTLSGREPAVENR